MSLLLGAPGGSLFSGYGGLDQAVEAATGASTVWVSDIDPGACRILAHRYPHADNLGDISAVSWTPPCPTCGEATRVRWSRLAVAAYLYECAACGQDHTSELRLRDPERTYPEPVRVMSGGFPCQDVSAAGKRAGLIDGTRSGLWAMFARAIWHMRPDLVVIENVRGLLTADGEQWHAALVEAQEAADHYARSLEVIRRRQHKYREDPAYVHRKKAEAHRVSRRLQRALGVVKRERRLVQRAIGTVLADLAYLGYDAQWVGLRAADVGAPHGRYRVFITAHPAGHPPSVERERGGAVRGQREGDPREAGGAGGPAPEDADGAARGERGLAAPGQTQGGRARPDAGGRGGDAPRVDEHLLPPPTAWQQGSADSETARTDLLPTAVQAMEHRRDLLLPTPTTQDAANNGGPSQHQRNTPPLNAVVPLMGSELLPTPSAADGLGGHERRGGARGDELLLGGVVKALEGDALLPPPSVADGNGGGRHGSPGHQMPLPGAVKGLLPTPSTLDHIEKRTTHKGGNPTLQGAVGGVSERDAARHHLELPQAPRNADARAAGEHLFPTPVANERDREPDEAEARHHRPGHGPDLSSAAALLPTPMTQPTSGNGHARDLGSEIRMLPTPTAADGKRETSSDNARENHSAQTLSEALLPTPRATDGSKGGPNQRGSSGDLMLPSAVQGLGDGDRDEPEEPSASSLLPTPRAQNGEERNQNIWERPDGQPQNLENALARPWGNYTAAVERWEAATRPAPPATAEGRNGGRRLNPAFVEWMMGLPLGWVTGPEVGLTRNEMLKALGNGVVPQQGYAAILHLLRVAQLVPNQEYVS